MPVPDLAIRDSYVIKSCRVDAFGILGLFLSIPSKQAEAADRPPVETDSERTSRLNTSVVGTVWRFFRHPTSPLPTYVGCALLAVLLPSYLLQLGAAAVFMAAGGDPAHLSHRSLEVGQLGDQFLSMVGYAPAMETIFIIATFDMAKRFKCSEPVAVFALAMLAGITHFRLAELSFFSASWSFMIYAVAYLAWSSKSIMQGVAAAWLPHMLRNAILFAVATAPL